MLKKLLVTALASLSLATAGLVTIDDFSTDQGPLTATGSDGPIGVGGGITRTLNLTTLAQATPVVFSLEVAGGNLDNTNGSLEDSEVVVTYSLPSALVFPVGASNYQFRLLVVASDGNPTDVALGGTAGVSGTFAIPANTSNQEVLFSVTPPIGPGTITLTLNGGLGWDLTLDSLGISYTDPVVTAIPEPGTFVLMGAGLLGVAFLRRK